MKINFTSINADLLTGVNFLSEDLNIETASDGVPIEVCAGEVLEVKYSAGRGLIRYKEKHHFFRALGLFIEHFDEREDFHITEIPRFRTIGVMTDCSRNAVLTVSSVKRLCRKMALMGLNMLMLYTEETYTVEGEPYFGYMRGRYTHNELCECDGYANALGIELIPCIQALGHLESFLRWRGVSKYKDTGRVLLCEEETTYNLIDRMLRSVSKSFRSKRIHLGLDETHNLGLGNYLTNNSYKNPKEIMRAHLDRVAEIAKKYGFEPMMWSDMFFKFASKKKNTENYDINAEITPEIVQGANPEFQLVYWDYYNFKKENYIKLIREHLKFGQKPIFAGGIWIWTGISPNYGRTFSTTNAALEACKETGIDEVIATLWFNGSEGNHFAGLLGLQLFAEHSYGEYDPSRLSKRFAFCTGLDSGAVFDLGKLDEIPGVEKGNPRSLNPSHVMLWQDILMGLFDKQFNVENLYSYYETLENQYRMNRETAGEWAFIFSTPEKSAQVLKIKAELGNKIRKAYLEHDKETLLEIANKTLFSLKTAVSELHVTHRNQWFSTYKAFGWEVLDLKYGGLLSRIDSVSIRLLDYCDGKIDVVDELEEEILPFAPAKPPTSAGYVEEWEINHATIVSANKLE
jgi:hypothetical protein